MNQVIAILDTEFGDKLRKLWPRSPVWIVRSPTNEPVVRSLRARAPAGAWDLASFGDFRRPPEENFLTELSAIDLHHGPDSSSTPYDELRVIGCKPTQVVRDALAEYGFQVIDELPDGFVARRNDEPRQ